jgi:prepilin-type N-terminal cleavage/methylation domain-containing protein
MRATATRRRSAAFTLIELLVVIGIIALLMGLLIPTISGSLAKANRMRCMSNARQLVLASLHYAGDHNGALPYPNWDNGIGARPDCPPGWAFDAHHPVTGTNTDGALWAYLKDHSVYHCPLDKSASTPGANPVVMLTSYVMNGNVGGLNSTVIISLAPAYAFNYTQFKPGDVLFWEGSASAMSSSGDLSSTPNEGMTFRHENRAAFACIDGHSDLISSDDYTANVVNNTSTRNQFWCNPAKPNGHQ